MGRVFCSLPGVPTEIRPCVNTSHSRVFWSVVREWTDVDPIARASLGSPWLDYCGPRSAPTPHG